VADPGFAVLGRVPAKGSLNDLWGELPVELFDQTV
jgi:hypothetical protein